MTQCSASIANEKINLKHTLKQNMQKNICSNRAQSSAVGKLSNCLCAGKRAVFCLFGSAIDSPYNKIQVCSYNSSNSSVVIYKQLKK